MQQQLKLYQEYLIFCDENVMKNTLDFYQSLNPKFNHVVKGRIKWDENRTDDYHTLLYYNRNIEAVECSYVIPLRDKIIEENVMRIRVSRSFDVIQKLIVQSKVKVKSLTWKYFVFDKERFDFQDFLNGIQFDGKWEIYKEFQGIALGKKKLILEEISEETTEESKFLETTEFMIDYHYRLNYFTRVEYRLEFEEPIEIQDVHIVEYGFMMQNSETKNIQRFLLNDHLCFFYFFFI